MIVGGIVLLCVLVGLVLNLDVWMANSPQPWDEFALTHQVESTGGKWANFLQEWKTKEEERARKENDLNVKLSNLQSEVQTMQMGLARYMDTLSGQLESLSHRPSEPSPPSQDGAKKPNIGVLIAWWPPQWYPLLLHGNASFQLLFMIVCRYMDLGKEEKEMIMTNRECYCRMHNYTLFVGSDIEVSHGYWAKLMHAKRVLSYSQVDWLFFGDMDFFITQFHRPLESLLDGLPEDVSLVLPQELEQHRRFSNFNFFIKNSKV